MIPLPAFEDVVVDAALVHEEVLHKLCGVVVEEVAEGVDGLGDGGGEERVLLGELLGQGDEGVERAGLRAGCEWAARRTVGAP